MEGGAYQSGAYPRKEIDRFEELVSDLIKQMEFIQDRIATLKDCKGDGHFLTIIDFLDEKTTELQVYLDDFVEEGITEEESDDDYEDGSSSGEI